MEYSKKLVLVPEDRVQVAEHLSELDQQMKNILQNKKLTDDEKVALYLQLLQKYTHFSIQKQESEPHTIESPEVEASPENSTNVKQETEELEEEISKIVPTRFQEKAKKIFQFLKHQDSIQWNTKGEILYEDKIVPGSNVVQLINDFLRNRKSIPEGRHVFLKALDDIHLPRNLDVHKKLYKNNSIVKKPIMYARRNAWLKL